MISHLGSHATQILLHLFNLPLTAGCLPKCWKEAVIQPIPKQEVGAYRPISLLSCLSKTMERAVLKTLRSLIHHLHQYTFARDNLASIHSLMDGKDTVVIFLDLETAFELAKEAIISTLARRGIVGKLLAWCNDYLTQRKA